MYQSIGLNNQSVNEIGSFNHYRRFRHRVWSFLEKDRTWPARLYSGTLILLILASLTEFIVSTMEPYKGDPEAKNGFKIAEYIIVVCFTVDLVVRVWAAVEDPRRPHWCWGRVNYLLTFHSVIDLLAVLPWYISEIVGSYDAYWASVFRVCILLRILKADQFTHSFKLLKLTLKSRGEQLLLALYFASIIIIVASAIMYFLEQGSGGYFENMLMTVQWTILLLTGAGLMQAPVTTLGQIVTSVTALLSIGLIALPTSILGAGFLDLVSQQRDQRKQQEEKEQEARQKLSSWIGLPKVACPRCHHEFQASQALVAEEQELEQH